MNWFMVHGSWFMVRPFRDFILVILSAALLSLPFINARLWVFAWFGFVPLFTVILGGSKAKAFWSAFLTGVFFWSFTIYWLIHVTLLGLAPLVLYLALYFGIFGLIVSRHKLLLTPYYLFLVPSVWVILEYVRSYLFTGFPWALLGYSQYLNLPAIQISDITGAWGVSFLVVMVNILLFKVIGNRLRVTGKGKGVFKKTHGYLLPYIFLITAFGYGFYRLHLSPATVRLSPMKISVVQGNIPQELKWDVLARDFILRRYADLTILAAKDNPDLIIWPEAASPCLLGEDPECFNIITDLARKAKTPLLSGVVTRENELFYNSAILISRRGEIVKRYDKVHLVPFGEYIPLKKVLPFLQTIVPIGDINRGEEFTVFTQSAKESKQDVFRFSVLICFEDLFPEISREFINRGADFLVNITNDAWYKKTAAPYQHLAASVFRAVENRVFLVRSANTGVSGFISPSGKLIYLVRDNKNRNIFIEGFSTQDIFTGGRKATFYNLHGEYFIFLLFIFFIYSIFRLIRRRG